eukprot:2495203-Prymnesium_polylepis.1
MGSTYAAIVKRTEAESGGRRRRVVSEAGQRWDRGGEWCTEAERWAEAGQRWWGRGGIEVGQRWDSGGIEAG